MISIALFVFGFLAAFLAVARYTAFAEGQYLRREIGALDGTVVVVLAVLAWGSRLLWGLGAWFIPVYAALTLSYGLTILRMRVPVCVAIAGILCNAAVTAANGGRMPIPIPTDEPGYVHITDGTSIAWLGDVIPLYDWDRSLFGWCSAGDVLLGTGAWMLAIGVWRGGRRVARE